MPLVRHKIKRYGRVPDTPDQRDHRNAAPSQNLAKLPAMVYLQPLCPEVGHDDSQQRFIVGSSWEIQERIRGYFTMAYGGIVHG